MSVSSSLMDANNKKTDSGGSSLPLPSPFTTTSDVIQQLNAALASLEGDPHDDVDNDDDAGDQTYDNKPRFELQKRFDNGATRRATQAELSAADLDTKMKQTAQHIATLTSAQERLDFCEAQIGYANKLFHNQQYQEAIDVYLTCLLVPEIQPNQNKNRNTTRQSEQEETQSSSFSSPPTPTPTNDQHCCHVEMFARVLNNLAQSALQLHWFQKCIRFCTIAIEHLQLENSDIHNGGSSRKNDNYLMMEAVQAQEGEVELPSSSPSSVSQAVFWGSDTMRDYAAKFYFKRAKANRLKGFYAEAKRDLQLTSQWLTNNNETQIHNNNDNNKNDDDERNNNKVSQMMKALQKEQRLLTQAVEHGRLNHQRQAHAMKQLLSSSSSSRSRTTTTTDDFSSPASSAVATADSNNNNNNNVTANTGSGASELAPLYEEVVAAASSSKSNKRRQFSTLRAPSKQQNRQHQQEEEDDDDYPMRMEQQRRSLPCWRRVLLVVLKLLLFMIGEEEQEEDGNDDDNHDDSNNKDRKELKLD